MTIMLSSHRLRQFGRTALVACAAAAVAAASEASNAGSPSTPATVFWDGAHLARVRAGEMKNDDAYGEVLRRLSNDAQHALGRGPYSVLDSPEIAISGDKHDYLSYSRYWWPNPDTADGLPYVRRDGETNRKLLAKGDREIIGALYDDVETLALAGYLLNDEKSAAHAAGLLRTWFLDPRTKMNPHLRYAQAVPGRSDGRKSGIIDTRHFIRVLDAAALLRETGAWSENDHQAVLSWMKEYLHWLRHDPMGQEEGAEANNHGTWYAAQVAAIAMHTGERSVARQMVENAKQRIARSIEPDGQQPEELERTKGLHYSVFNLSALAVLARIGEQVDVDLWNYETKDGGSMRRALDFVMPYLAGEKKWPHQQIERWHVSTSDAGLFALASKRYSNPRFLDGLQAADADPPGFYYTRLLFPRE
jgi:Alginate lyase